MIIRHRQPRAHFPALAMLVLAPNRSFGPFFVENLSTGGALLTGTVPEVGRTLALGTAVGVQLQLPACPPLRLAATIVRTAEDAQSGQGIAFAVKFQDLSAQSEDLIHNAVLRAIDESRAGSERAVLVLDASSEDRRALVRGLEGLGRRAFSAVTFLDALRSLQDPDLRIEVVMVDVSGTARDAPAFTGLDVLAFLAADFAQLRRVVLVSRQGDAYALSAARGFGDAVLFKPAEPADLLAVIGSER